MTDTMDKSQDTHRQPYSWHQVGTSSTPSTALVVVAQSLSG